MRSGAKAEKQVRCREAARYAGGAVEKRRCRARSAARTRLSAAREQRAATLYAAGVQPDRAGADAALAARYGH